MFMMGSKSLLGVNMLQIADNKPDIIRYCLENIVHLTTEKVFTPYPATVFQVQEIARAHELLEKRKTMGKIAIQW
jgi:NADPH2:quinone reductase